MIAPVQTAFALRVLVVPWLLVCALPARFCVCNSEQRLADVGHLDDL
jgi:hypothetical protein